MSWAALLMHCVSAAGMPNLGLETGRRSGLEVLGIIGHLARHAPDVGSALRTIILYLHLHDRGAVPVLWEKGSQAMFGYVIHRPDVPGIEQIYDGALAIAFNILGSLVGRDWKASEVWLHRAPPADVGPYRRHFPCRMRFAAPRAAVVFPADDLQRRDSFDSPAPPLRSRPWSKRGSDSGPARERPLAPGAVTCCNPDPCSTCCGEDP